MKIKKGDCVRLIHNNPEPDLGLKPGMEGIFTGEITRAGDDRVLWYRIEWPHDKWWVPGCQIKVIKS